MHKSKCIKLHTSSYDFSYMVPVFFFVPSLLPTFFLISQLPHQADSYEMFYFDFSWRCLDHPWYDVA